METYDLYITVYNGHRHRPTTQESLDYPNIGRAFAGVDYTNVLNAEDLVSRRITVPGWWVSTDTVTPLCKIVRIELPEGVHAGRYSIGNTEQDGLYGDYNAHDGAGQTVYAYCSESVEAIRTGKSDGSDGAIYFTDEDCIKAIDAAIASGIILSVPTEKWGVRKEVPGRVVQISKAFSGRQPPDLWD